MHNIKFCDKKHGKYTKYDSVNQFWKSKLRKTGQHQNYKLILATFIKYSSILRIIRQNLNCLTFKNHRKAKLHFPLDRIQVSKITRIFLSHHQTAVYTLSPYRNKMGRSELHLQRRRNQGGIYSISLQIFNLQKKG